MFEKILRNNYITLHLSTKFQKDMLKIAKKVIWTGKIDEFFGYEFGHLPYRSLQFEFSHHAVEYLQPCEQINFPEKNVPWTRTVEIKHVTGQKIQGTTISTEYPMSEGDPYYPIPTKKNHYLYNKYDTLASQERDIIFLGRLARYRYMNMDEVVRMALATFSDIKKDFFNT
jgi:UDP-galactopyranose mutase